MGGSEIVIYRDEDGNVSVEVRLDNDTIWLTQAQMADLFEVSPKTISEHIQNIIADEELDGESTIRKFRIVTENGKTTKANHYNLEMIISVGYRVKSKTAVRFRRWANKILNEYLVKGFVINPARIAYDTGYFNDLLRKIREIRASEREMYLQVRDLMATTSIDYDSENEEIHQFFSTLQNKFHHAITGQTGAEIIMNRIDGGKRNMGMTSWKGEKITEQSAKVAKNYLGQSELEQYERLVSLFFDFAIFQAQVNKKTMTMAEWLKKFDGFLELSERPILNNAGSVSSEQVRDRVKQELKSYKGRLSYGGDMPDEG